jgi:hypothetical protein
MQFNECQDLYIKLLLHLKRGSPGSEVIWKLEETEKCDKFTDFSDIRKKVKNRIIETKSLRSNEKIESNIEFISKWDDERIADAIVRDEFVVLRRRSTYALSYKNYIWYNIELQWDNILSFFGGSAIGLGSLSYIQYKKSAKFR